MKTKGTKTLKELFTKLSKYSKYVCILLSLYCSKGKQPSFLAIFNIPSDSGTPGITTTLIKDSSTEQGGVASFSLVLNSQPTHDVSIQLYSSDTTEGILDSETVSFTTTNWQKTQTVTVTGIDDTLADGNQSYSVVFQSIQSDDTNYSSLILPNAISLQNIDDETPNVITGAISGNTTETGTTATFTIKLTTQPASDVTICLSSSNIAEGTIQISGDVLGANATCSVARVEFSQSNYNIDQTVTVVGVNDYVLDGDQTFTISFTASSLDAYNGIAISSVNVTNVDDGSGFTLGSVSGNTTEAGGTATFTIKPIAAPSNDVFVCLISSDTTEGDIVVGGDITTSAGSCSNGPLLKFTTANWNTNQTVTIQGVDDQLDDGDISYQIQFSVESVDSNYNAISLTNVNLINTDNDTAGLTVSSISGNTTEAGGTATFTLKLNTEPSSNVYVCLASDNTVQGEIVVSGDVDSPSGDCSIGMLSFDNSNWSTNKTVTVQGNHDSILPPADDTYHISYSVSTNSSTEYLTVSSGNVALVNKDIDPWTKRRKLTLNNPSTTEDLVNFPILVKLNDPSRIDYNYTMDSGQDVLFVDSGGNFLDYEIEKWDETGDSTLWVRVPLIDHDSSTEDYIYIYYGYNLSGSPSQNPTGVWSSNYKAVYHLSEATSGTATGTGTVLDSTSNANHGDPINSPTYTSTNTGTGLQFNGTSQYVSVPDSNSLRISGNLTIEVYSSCNGCSTSGAYYYIEKGMNDVDNYGLAVWNNKLIFEYVDTSSNYQWELTSVGAVPFDTYTYLASVVDNSAGTTSDIILYVDGVQKQLAANNPLLGNQTNNLLIGKQNYGSANFYFKGVIDEVRISTTARSSEWINAQNQAIKDNGFITYGAEEGL
ncbi:MAG: DUF2341 domain-containing protein [Leptospiraceae bacterium]|nr:DUF2341 domain-containing protein [Leptospiraceae bacterium]